MSELETSGFETYDAAEAAIDAAVDQFLKLDSAAEREMLAIDTQRGRPSRQDNHRRDDLKELRRQIERGVAPAEGVDRRLHAVLQHPAVKRFHFERPGLAPLERLRARLRAERKAEEAGAKDWPRVYRFTGPGRHAVGARDLEPGDVVELSEEQAASFADRFVPADQPTPAAPDAEVDATD